MKVGCPPCVVKHFLLRWCRLWLGVKGLGVMCRANVLVAVKVLSDVFVCVCVYRECGFRELPLLSSKICVFVHVCDFTAV